MWFKCQSFIQSQTTRPCFSLRSTLDKALNLKLSASNTENVFKYHSVIFSPMLHTMIVFKETHQFHHFIFYVMMEEVCWVQSCSQKETLARRKMTTPSHFYSWLLCAQMIHGDEREKASRVRLACRGAHFPAALKTLPLIKHKVFNSHMWPCRNLFNLIQRGRSSAWHFNHTWRVNGKKMKLLIQIDENTCK